MKVKGSTGKYYGAHIFLQIFSVWLAIEIISDFHVKFSITWSFQFPPKPTKASDFHARKSVVFPTWQVYNFCMVCLT